jgi:hypothetical protein
MLVRLAIKSADARSAMRWWCDGSQNHVAENVGYLRAALHA